MKIKVLDGENLKPLEIVDKPELDILKVEYWTGEQVLYVLAKKTDNG